MEHHYVRDDKFNILTVKYEKDGSFFVTGESHEGIDVNDTIDYIVNDKFDVLGVAEITERRDSRSFPKGNNLHYECKCKVVPNPDPNYIKKLNKEK